MKDTENSWGCRKRFSLKHRNSPKSSLRCSELPHLKAISVWLRLIRVMRDLQNTMKQSLPEAPNSFAMLYESMRSKFQCFSPVNLR